MWKIQQLLFSGPRPISPSSSPLGPSPLRPTCFFSRLRPSQPSPSLSRSFFPPVLSSLLGTVHAARLGRLAQLGRSRKPGTGPTDSPSAHPAPPSLLPPPQPCSPRPTPCIQCRCPGIISYPAPTHRPHLRPTCSFASVLLLSGAHYSFTPYDCALTSTCTGLRLPMPPASSRHHSGKHTSSGCLQCGPTTSSSLPIRWLSCPIASPHPSKAWPRHLRACTGHHPLPPASGKLFPHHPCHGASPDPLHLPLWLIEASSPENTAAISSSPKPAATILSLSLPPRCSSVRFLMVGAAPWSPETFPTAGHSSSPPE